MKKVIAGIFAAAALFTIPVATANATAVEHGTITQSTNVKGTSYWICRKGTYSFGGYYSDFVIINAQQQGWRCYR